MERRIDYRKRLENNRRKKKLARISILSAFGIIGATSAIPALASEWTANTPESIQIEQGATSYTMKSGDTLWAIGVKINVNVNTLASVNNIDLDSGEQFSLKVGTVIHFSESEIKATNSNGQAVNEGVKANDSNKIVVDKPIGTDVSKDIADGKASNNDIIGKPDNTGKLPKPNTGGNANNDNSSNNNGGEKPVKPTYPETEKPVDPEAPTNVDKFVIINIDEDGNILESTEGYTFVSESTDKKVVKDDKENSITTYTTTKVWTKEDVKPTEPTNKDVFVTINIDDHGVVLESTDGYLFFSESTDKSVETDKDGNTITTYTTTKVWVKEQKPSTPTNKDIFVTVNVDTEGAVLENTEGYSFVSESTDNGVVVTLDNGNTETTFTTTRVWKKDHVSSNEDKYVTVNVDTNGSVLSSTDGYTYVSESTTSNVQTLPNGDTITTYTTTVVWQKNAPSEVVPVEPVGNSGILTPDLGEAGRLGGIMHNDPNSEFSKMWSDDDWETAYGYAWKTIRVLMSDGSKWYSVEFYVVEI